MYSISQIKAGLSSPKSIARELNRRISREGHQKRYNTNGIDVFTEDWDNLVAQPSTPFMGRTVEQYFTKFGLSRLPELIRKDDITVDRVKTAYEETLEITVPYISELIESLEGKTVVTADHGEMLGKRYRPMPVQEFGHHSGIYRDELVKVPWLTIESNQRKTIVSKVSEQDEIDSGEIDDRLRDFRV